jgi:hypothetical protein
MAKTRTRVEGLREVKDALEELPKATSRNVQLRVLKKWAEPIKSDGEARAPKLTGKSALTYAVSTKLSRRQRRLHPKESPVEVYVGPSPNPSLLQQEFGNKNHGPQPHLRPAWDGNKDRSFSGITQDFWDEIKKAADRLAKKAAKAARKA